MPKMDTFTATLILVLILIGALVVISAFFPYYPDGVPDSVRVIHNFSAGTIGFSENYVSRVQNFGSIDVGVPQMHSLEKYPRMEISAGYFGSTSEQFTVDIPEYVLDWVKSGEITFDIYDTNQYGNLIIKWNGEEVYNDNKGRGEETISLRSSQLKEENDLEISASGPGLMFWAATLYELRNFNVNAEYGPAKFLDFRTSQDELESLDHFELEWYTATRRGKLLIKVNGDEIYNSEPERQESIEFTDSLLSTSTILPGNNRLAFFAINGSFELKDVIMKTYVSKNQRVMREKFTITEAQVNSLKAKGGLVRLYVEDVENDGEIRIKLNEQSAGSVSAHGGWNSISFSGDLAERGTNWLEVSGTGTFVVEDISVEIVQ